MKLEDFRPGDVVQLATLEGPKMVVLLVKEAMIRFGETWETPAFVYVMFWDADLHIRYEKIEWPIGLVKVNG